MFVELVCAKQWRIVMVDQVGLNVLCVYMQFPMILRMNLCVKQECVNYTILKYVVFCSVIISFKMDDITPWDEE